MSEAKADARRGPARRVGVVCPPDDAQSARSIVIEGVAERRLARLAIARLIGPACGFFRSVEGSRKANGPSRRPGASGFAGFSHRWTNGRALARTRLAALSLPPVSPMTGMEQRSVRVGGPLEARYRRRPSREPSESGQCLARAYGCGKRRGKSRRRKESRLNNIAQAANTARRETGISIGPKDFVLTQRPASRNDVRCRPRPRRAGEPPIQSIFQPASL